MPLLRFTSKQLLAAFAAVAVGLWLFASLYPFGPLLSLLYGLAWAGMAGFAYKQDTIGSVALLAIPVVAFFGLPAIMMNGHPVPLSRLRQVQPGATRAEVNSILGAPSHSDDGDWVYSGFTWCYITVEFSPEGKVVSVVHDH